jgi:hypothetical protein
MRESKKIKYRGKQSEILESIPYEGYEIKSLKHGNTGNILYCSPSKEYNWEDCWGMDLQAAKNNVIKHKQHLAESGSVPG